MAERIRARMVTHPHEYPRPIMFDAIWPLALVPGPTAEAMRSIRYTTHHGMTCDDDGVLRTYILINRRKPPPYARPACLY